jgi:Zn-dependent M28 family amino/carboxypeptidase
MTPVVAAPATVALAALAGWRRLTRLAGLVCGGIIASFAHIALSPTVPGANDNLTGVATLLALAEALEERPVEGLKVLLVSTGAEESLMEGMRAFAARHFSALNRDRTYVLCVDTVGSPHLLLAEEEGMLQVRRYDPGFTALVASCAADAGVALRAGVSMRLGTDGYLALRYDVPAALLISVDDYGGASNYHWPTDTPERVDYASLDGAVAICESVIRRLAAPSVG